MKYDPLMKPIEYLEMLFGRFIYFEGTLEQNRVNYFIFMEIVNAFYATSAFTDLHDVNKASKMCKDLLEIKNLKFSDECD